MTAKRVAAISVIAATVLVSCSSTGPTPSPVRSLGREVAREITDDRMYVHLRSLQEIADANNGTRADGTPGYTATVEYVAQVLRDNGFDVNTPEFERIGSTRQGDQKLAVAGRDFPVDQASLLRTTPHGGLSGLTVRPQKAPGCTAADYGSAVVEDAIVVVDDTGCSVVDKQNVATDKGAVALLVVSLPSDIGSPPALFPPGYYRQLKVPVGVIGADADAALRRTNAAVRLTLESKAVMVTSRNVLAQTKTGDARNVVMVGAHLDSAPGSPGINADGSGIAALLATVEVLGSRPDLTNAVLFALWGGTGQEGATRYLAGLDENQLNDIALYLDVDMIGSSNAGYFTYDGDQSGQPNPDVPADDVPPGSAGIERTLAGYLNLSGTRPADMPLARSADYGPFLAAGIPIGGTTTGGAQKKTPTQARLWGGQVGVAFDPYYRTPRDTIDNVNRDAMAVMGPAVAFAVGTYAQSIDGVNGVPARDQRHRSTP